MPAPVECKADFITQSFDGIYSNPSPVTMLTLSCKKCPLETISFRANSRYFSNPERTVIRNAGEFLGRRCGLKSEREPVILPRGL